MALRHPWFTEAKHISRRTRRARNEQAAFWEERRHAELVEVRKRFMKEEDDEEFSEMSYSEDSEDSSSGTLRSRSSASQDSRLHRRLEDQFSRSNYSFSVKSAKAALDRFGSQYTETSEYSWTEEVIPKEANEY